MGQRVAARAAGADPAAAADFEEAATLVPRDMVAESVTCGPDVDAHLAQIRQFVDAGVDEIYVQQIGPDLDGFFSTFQRDVLPQLR